MDVFQVAVPSFYVGQDHADVVAKPLVAKGYKPERVFKGVDIHAGKNNTGVLYVGHENVTSDTGYPLSANEHLHVAVDDLHTIFVSSVPANNTTQVVTVTAPNASNEFILMLNGLTTAPLAAAAIHDTVQAALETLVGAGNVAVSGNAGGPYTVEFIGDLAKTDMPLIATGFVNERQTIVVTGSAAGDKVVLTLGGLPTVEMNADSSAVDVGLALKALVGSGNVNVTDAIGGGWLVEFGGVLAATDVPTITGTCGKNEKQTITVAGATAYDRLTLTYSGQSTTALPPDATAHTVAAALKALSNIGDTDVVVTNVAGGWQVEFVGTMAKTDVAGITGTCGRNAQQTITVTGGQVADSFVLMYDGHLTSSLAYNVSSANLQTALRALAGINGANVNVSDADGGGWLVEFVGTLARTDVPVIAGVCGHNETQRVSLDASVTGGTFTLAFGGKTTTDLAFDISAEDLQTALCALSSIDDGNVVVSADSVSGWDVEFTGTFTNSDVAVLVGDGAKLTGEDETVVTDVMVAESLKGHAATVSVVETAGGRNVPVVVTELVKGNAGTVTVTETLKGDGTGEVTTTQSAGASDGCKFEWIAE